MKENQKHDLKRVQSMGQFLSLYSSPTSMDAPSYSPTANANQASEDKKGDEELKSKTEKEKAKPKSTAKAPSNEAADAKNVSNGSYVAGLEGSAKQKPPVINSPPSSSSDKESEEKEKSEVSTLEIAQGGNTPNSNDSKAAGNANDEGISLSQMRDLVNYVLKFVGGMQGILTTPDKTKGANKGGMKKDNNDDNEGESEFPKVEIGESKIVKEIKSKPLPEKKDEQKNEIGVGGKRALDEVVDPYMESNWDRSKYTEITTKYNVVPTNVGTFMDTLLPPDVSPEVRYTANLVYSVATGGLDVVYLSAIAGLPVVGIIGGPIYAIRDMINAVGKVPDLDGSWADEAITVVEVLRGIFDTVNNFIGGIEGTITLAQYIATACGGTLAGILGGVVGSAATPAGTAAGGAAGATAGGATGNVVGGFAQSPLVASSLGLQAAITICDTAITLLSLKAESDAQQMGKMGKAKAFGEMAESHAFKAAADALALIMSVGFELASAGNAPGAIIREATEQFGKKSFKELVKHTGKKALGKGLKQVGKKAPKKGVSKVGEVPGNADWWNELQIKIGGGDVLRGKDPFVNPDGVKEEGDAAPLLSGERDKTIDNYQTSWENLKAEDPLWHQKLLNTMLFPDIPSMGATINKLMVPSGWLELILGAGRDLGTAFPSLMQNLKASTIIGFADLLDGKIEPFINWMIQMIAENSDIEKDLDVLNEIVEDQRLTLEFLRNSLKNLEETISSIKETLKIGPEIELSLNLNIEQLQGMKLTRDMLNIPDLIPDFLVEQLLGPFNQMIDDLILKLKTKISQIRETINSQIDGIEKILQAEIDEVKEIIKEGGDAEKVFIKAQDKLAKQVSEFLEFASKFMSGGYRVDLSGFTETVRAIGEKVQKASHENRWKEFIEYLKTKAQADVDDWKARHGDEVHLIFYPMMPKNEVAALDKANSLLTNRLQNADISPKFTEKDREAATKALSSYYVEAKSLVGSKGQDNIYNFWTALNKIAGIQVPVKEKKKEEPNKKKKEKEKPKTSKPIIHVVVKKNNLWNLAKHYYGDPNLYKKIHKANADKVKDPHWIYPGQELVIPRLPSLKEKFQ